MTPLEMITEWRKGCSCAHAGKPEECHECTRALIDALERKLGDTGAVDDPPKLLLFAGSSYYATGGIYDFVGLFDSIESALAAAEIEMRHRDWFHIIDNRTQKVVAYAPGEHCGYDEDMVGDAVKYWPDKDGVLKVVK